MTWGSLGDAGQIAGPAWSGVLFLKGTVAARSVGFFSAIHALLPAPRGRAFDHGFSRILVIPQRRENS